MTIEKFKQVLAPSALIAAVLAIWWLIVVQSGSVIFPTPLQVLTGTLELVDDGTLWQHIGASLFRVGCGFLVALMVALPMGLWMGRTDGIFRTFNPISRSCGRSRRLPGSRCRSCGSGSATCRRFSSSSSPPYSR